LTFLQCLYGAAKDGISCNDGAATCERGACTGPANSVVRRAATQKPTVSAENGKLVLTGQDVTFSILEKAGTSTNDFVPANIFSVTDMKSSLEDVSDVQVYVHHQQQVLMLVFKDVNFGVQRWHM
jgi:hypothetical protein